MPSSRPLKGAFGNSNNNRTNRATTTNPNGSSTSKSRRDRKRSRRSSSTDDNNNNNNNDRQFWWERAIQNPKPYLLAAMALCIVGIEIKDIGGTIERETLRAVQREQDIPVVGLLQHPQQPLQETGQQLPLQQPPQPLLQYNNQKILEQAGAFGRSQQQENKVALVRGGGGAVEDPSAGQDQTVGSLRHLADLSVPYNGASETPFFWHLAKSGGTSLKHMYSDCYGLVEACESGVAEGHASDITLRVVTLESTWSFVNVDVTTERGIRRAASLQVVASRKAHLVVSPLLHPSAQQLFTHRNKGRFFTVFRDPLDRVVSLFYYLQKATWEPTYNPTLQQMSFASYVNSSLVESNFVVRTLLDKMEAPLTQEDFGVAKEILRTKCLVGLLEELDETVRRVDLYFGFRPKDDADGFQACRSKYLQQGTNRHQHPALPAPDTTAYQELARKNFMDVWLYDYAKELFAQQAALFP